MNIDPQHKPPRIVYIMGAGRSGSTILNIVLGAHPEIESLGEAKHWAIYKGLPRNYTMNSENYIFWQKVLREYTKFASCFPDFNKIENIRFYVESHNNFKYHFFKNIPSKVINDYNQHISNLFLSVLKVSEKKIILDASKNIFRAKRLLDNSQFDVKVIHLIRDPRGIVWSFMKKNVEQSPKKPLRALFDYIILNLASIFVKYSFKDEVIKVRYEDIIHQPRRTLKQIFDFIEVDDDDVIEKIENNSEFKLNHIIDGNRIRKSKSIKFNPDEEWIKKLPFHYKIICVLFGWPIYLL